MTRNLFGSHQTPRLNWTKVELRLKKKWEGLFVPSRVFELNQSGIETDPRVREPDLTDRTVWIEPKWNWDFVKRTNPPPVVSVWIEPKWNWDNHIPYLGVNSPFATVWIEPKWNWDGGNQLTKESWIIKFELNQSGIETICNLLNTSLLLKFVWIEPKWNWDAMLQEKISSF